MRGLLGENGCEAFGAAGAPAHWYGCRARDGHCDGHRLALQDGAGKRPPGCGAAAACGGSGGRAGDEEQGAGERERGYLAWLLAKPG